MNFAFSKTFLVPEIQQYDLAVRKAQNKSPFYSQWKSQQVIKRFNEKYGNIMFGIPL